MNPTTEPLAELEIVFQDTNALAVADGERAALVAKLKPIAALIPDYLQYAADVKVTNKDQADQAALARDAILASSGDAEKALREFDNKLIERLFKTHRAWTALIGRFSVLNDAAKKVKQVILQWQAAEEQKALKEQQRLQAESDERARLERERLEKQAAKLKTPELKEQRMEQAAAVTAPVVFVAPPTKAVSAQKRWKVKSVDMTLMGIPPAVQGYITVETSRLERVKAANSLLTVSGVEFHQVLV